MSEPGLSVPFPVLHKDVAVEGYRRAPARIGDARRTFAEASVSAGRDPKAEDAFIAHKLHVIKTQPELGEKGRREAVADLARHLDVLPQVLEKEYVRAPGGIGRGFSYNTAFKSGFELGTSCAFQVVCPAAPGGNVDTWLYLTTMNRARRGIEAFVWYNAQERPRFKVFDWARTDHWQIDCSFDDLADYALTTTVHGEEHRTMWVWNSTYRVATAQWRNEALLWNGVARRWDVIYRYEYVADDAEQPGGYIGSWGPTIETFQNRYARTAPMGFVNHMLVACDADGEWGSWSALQPDQSWLRTDGQGFRTVFLDRNHAFVVRS